MLREAFDIFSQDGGDLFLAAAVILGTVYLVFRSGEWGFRTLAAWINGLLEARERAVRELVDSLNQQHDECKKRCSHLELEIGEQRLKIERLEQHNHSLNQMVLDLRDRMYGRRSTGG